MKKTIVFLLLIALTLSLAACADPVVGAPASSSGTDPEAERVITLSGDSASYPGSGVAIEGSTVRIGAPGEYTVRGTLNDGRIVVDLRENPGQVTLILDGVDICCLNDSAIHLVQAKELYLVLAAGSENRVVSGTESDLAAWTSASTGAAIYAEDDLTVRGEGSLLVTGYINNAIASKDDLKLQGGTLTLTAANNGLRGSESVTVSGGTIRVEAGNDGVKSSSATKAGKGFVLIEGGELTVRAGGDGVSAETELSVTNGLVNVETTGDPAAASCKGLKGKTGLTISGGEIQVHAQDHAIRSQAALTVSGGTLRAESEQGKGLSAEAALTVSGGTLTVVSADDGLVSVTDVTISGGELNIRSGADGIQGGKKGTGFGETVGSVSIEGGTTLVSAFNKPVDAKAVFTLSGGTIFACGGGSVAPEGELPRLLTSCSGAAGDTVTLELGGRSHALQSAYPFTTLLFADEALVSGQSYSLQLGGQKLSLTA